MIVAEALDRLRDWPFGEVRAEVCVRKLLAFCALITEPVHPLVVLQFRLLVFSRFSA